MIVRSALASPRLCRNGSDEDVAKMRDKQKEPSAEGADGYNTWPERRGCIDMSATSGTMPLNRALDCISLAYNPITKQLHFVTPRTQPPPPPLPPPPPPDDAKKSSVSDEECGSPESPESPGLGHRRAPGGSSFSSTVSSLSEASSGRDDPKDATGPQHQPKAKKKGLSSFFARGVFPWKSNGLSNSDCKSQVSSDSNSSNGFGSSWKLLVGRSNSLGCSSIDSLSIDTPASSGASTPLHHKRQGSNASASEIKQFEDLVASSVALIQHNRPSNLPAKDMAEEQRHRAEYQRMVVAARQREAREAKERKRQLAKQARHEDDLSAALKEWNTNVLPCWETSKNTKKTKDLWWCGLPPAVRGKVWQLAIPNNLNITPQLYHICVERAKQRLIEAKLRKNGFKLDKGDSNHKNTLINKSYHNETNGDIKHQRLKSEENINKICDDKNNSVKCSDFTCDDATLNSTDLCNNHDENNLRLLDIVKDSQMHRNFSEQNLKKYSLDTCDLKKNSQSNPDLCEYSNEWSMELIQLDISRTFPNLCIFQPGGPYFDVLHELLAAYVCYRPDIGYVQGMSFLAAILILNMDAPEAFVCFSNLLNGTVLRAAFSRDGSTMQILWLVYSHLMEANLPAVYKHFQESGLGPELYLLEWLYSVFAKAMPLDVACRVWDVFLRDGDEFLFKTALGVLHLYQDMLIKSDFITAAQFLTKLPEDLCSNLLFKSINAINMSIDKLSFQQLVDKYKE